MANYTNLSGSVTGTSRADKFTYTAFPSPWATLDGGAGIDVLDINTSSTSRVDVVVRDAFNSGVFLGRVADGAYGPWIQFYNMENVKVAGSSGADDFSLQIGSNSLGLLVNFAAGAGDDHLELDFRGLTTNFSFQVASGTITSTFGQFSGFESFTIYAGAGNDTIVTGDGNDVVWSGTGHDSVSTGAGDDDVYSQSTGGTFDLGEGSFDHWGGNFTGVSANLSFTLGDVLTVSDGTTVTNAEFVTLGGGAGNDNYTVTAISNGELYGGDGVDTLIYNVTASAGQYFSLLTYNDGLLQGGISQINSPGSLSYSEFEQVQWRGSEQDDEFELVGLFSADQVTIDGAGGNDFLYLNGQLFTSDLNLFVAADGAITSNLGQFSSLETFQLGGGAGADSFVTGAGNDQLSGGSGNDSLKGGGGGDVLDGGDGNDALWGEDGADFLYGGSGDDTLNGGAGNDKLFGDDGFIGDDGVDSMDGGDGSDIYYITVASGHAVAEISDSGSATDVDEVRFGTYGAPQTLTLYAGDTGIERIVIGSGVEASADTSGSTAHNVDASRLANGVTIIGNSGANSLIGTSFADSLFGGEGADVLIGGAGNDALDGGTFNDLLDGGEGADTMTGGTGDDTYIVENSGDRAIESVGGGIDLVKSSVNFTLGANVENLTLTGSAAINGFGNGLDNVITGNTAANVLNGGAGADLMYGGLGNDTYIIDNVGDQAIETSNKGGIDVVQSSVTFALGANVENLTLTGSAAIKGTGNSLANIIIGNSANNVLNGLFGSDSMFGGLGNDTYFVDNVGDSVTELAGQGTDLVFAGITYTLGANVENLTLSGTAAINGTGNALNNILTGNSAANVLDGGAGADIMSGGLGNDTYIVDNAGDRAKEISATGGIDLVQSSVNFTLGANVENLTLTGSAAINGFGNSLANIITGNSANNVLNGGAGADSMSGGLGDDTYVVDNAGDTVTELANEGTDRVLASITHTLGANVENLTLTGTAAINGTGNDLANTIIGNSAGNVLNGGTGNDTLTGGAGADSFLFDTALSGSTNVDQIKDFSVVDDTMMLDNHIFTAVGAAGTLSTNAFYSGTASHDADDRIIYDSATGNIYYDADGSGAGAQVLFAHVTAGLALTNTDFGIVG